MESALIYDKKIFSYIYEMEKRRSNRDWHSTYLVQLELAEYNNQGFDANNQKFLRLLMKNMRAEDIIYQWDDNIFLLILCDLKNEDATKIVARISDNYFKNRKREESGLEVSMRSIK